MRERGSGEEEEEEEEREDYYCGPGSVAYEKFELQSPALKGL